MSDSDLVGNEDSRQYINRQILDEDSAFEDVKEVNNPELQKKSIKFIKVYLDRVKKNDDE